MEQEYSAATPADFQPLITDLLGQYEASGNSNLVIALSGDLGAGKTAFTQELAKFLGVSELVTSPTFTIMKQYEIEHVNFDKLVHIDAYRFESEDEAAPLRLKEVLLESRTIVCVEWPERMANVIPEHTIWINLAIIKNNVRLAAVRQR